MNRQLDRLYTLLRPSLDAMGYVLWGLEQSNDLKPTLRVYIDSDKGVGLDDCSQVSRQIGLLIDVEDVFDGAYQLEVSSPGINRRLFFPEQYQQYIGCELEIKIQVPIENQRNFKGTLATVGQGSLELAVDDKRVSLEFENVMKAKVIPKL